MRSSSLLVAALALAASASLAFASTASLSADTTRMDWSQVAEYRIVPGDQLRLNYGINPTGDSDVIREAVVRPDGRITVFPIGDVVAAGLTPSELQSSIVKQLASQLREPRVTVEVSKVAANMVHVLGQVQAPKAVEAGPFTTVLQAISAAGGFTNDASKNSVLVFHRDGARTVRVTRIRLDHALKTGDLSRDIPVGRFDIVYVPRNTVGNLSVFTQQLFGSTSSILNTALAGWELFNLDRVFVVDTR